MPRLVRKTPNYRVHKASGQAVVTLNKRTIYLGTYGTADSRARYDSLVSQWLAAGRRLEAAPEPGRYTVDQLAAEYLKYAEGYYRGPDGRPTSELRLIRSALRPLSELYGHTLAGSFGAMALQKVRQRGSQPWQRPQQGAARSNPGWSRRTINKQVGRIRAMFKWAVAAELLPSSVYDGLAAVAGLKAGRCAARESKGVRPIEQAAIAASLAFMPAHFADMVRLQMLTGMRPGEVCAMRRRDVDTSSEPWCYRPAHHKTEHFGMTREVFLGPKCKQILEARGITAMAPEGLLFKGGTNQTGKPVSVGGYRRAIARACKEAGIPPWAPNRIRHTAATRIRAEFGLEGAQAILGHARVTTTQIYAEKDVSKAQNIMQKVG